MVSDWIFSLVWLSFDLFLGYYLVPINRPIIGIGRFWFLRDRSFTKFHILGTVFFTKLIFQINLIQYCSSWFFYREVLHVLHEEGELYVSNLIMGLTFNLESVYSELPRDTYLLISGLNFSRNAMNNTGFQF